MSTSPPALQPVVEFAYLTGWRVPGEVLALEWRQVDRTTWTIRRDPRSTKNRRERVVDVSSDTGLEASLAALWRELRVQRCGTCYGLVYAIPSR